MRRVILSTVLLIGIFGSLNANPIPEVRIECINAFPPEVGVMCYMDVDLNGDSIVTSSGSALITGFVFPGYDEMFVFDSSNTTGFTINSEADFVRLSSFYWDEVSFGNLGYAPAPINGHYIRYYEIFPFYGWSFDFSSSNWGTTDVVFNEINAHGTWNSGSNFIELYNQSDDPVDIGGWMIVCDTVCAIPQNTMIEGNGFYVVDQACFPAIFDMDDGADNVYLVDSDNILVDQVGWSSDHGADVSFMRYPDGVIDTTIWAGYMGYDDVTSCTFENGFPSRGAPNRHQSPGFVVIGTHAAATGQDVSIWWTDPVWDQNFDYSMVIGNLDHFPADPTDGYSVYQGTDQEAVDTGLPNNTVVHYTVFARNAGGGYSVPTDESRVFVILGTVGIDGESNLPERISNLNCYPNPFNATVTVDFVLSQAGSANLAIYNLRGQRVEILADGLRTAGEHRITWDGSDYPSGVYFARLEAGGSSKSIKMVLLK